MQDYKTLLGIIAGFLGVIGYFPYLIDIFRGRTKPHAFTWLIWAILAGVLFFAQITEQAGAGLWLTGITGSISALIFGLSLFKGVKQFAKFDWFCLAGAGVAILLWRTTGEPLLAVILIVIIDICAMLPLLRHSYLKPWEETASMFAIYFFAWIFALLALANYTATTFLYGAYSVVMNAVVVFTLVYRRRSLAGRA